LAQLFKCMSPSHRLAAPGPKHYIEQAFDKNTANMAQIFHDACGAAT
jgi:hypothetical protein